ncbi:hypothetical protein AMJ50_00875 [Parcubacteria bacterium DG_74_3]|nr:MAG: hypothetical protein AMJ50_00875 [Parcubacteria bacterium DG_74_3]
MQMPILEFNAVNPLTYPFGPILPMNLFCLLVHIPIVFGFGAAAYWIIGYTKKFYGGRPIPEEWRSFWMAMVWGTVHELIETILLYQWIVGQVLLIVFFVVQVIAGIYLVWGSYLLAKKYIIRG